MSRFIAILIALCIHSSLLASDLIRYPDTSAKLKDRIEWAFDSAKNEKAFWIGYSVLRLQHPRATFLSGISIDGLKLESKPTLQEWIYGASKTETKSVREAAESELKRSEQPAQKVWKEVGIFLRFQPRASGPSRIQVMNLTIGASFDGPLYWLGNATHEESFSYVSSLYSHGQNADNKEDVMAAIGIHPPKQAFPFLKNILTSDEPEEAQEAAAIFIGELDQQESLSLLQKVSETSKHESVREAAVIGIAEMQLPAAHQTLCDIARSHRDPDLRETAIIMLGDKKGEKALKMLEQIAWFDEDSDIRETAIVALGESEAGTAALMKIMEEHPSAETREAAVYALAETAVGKKALKNKIKQ